nr:MAG TPA: hypothetical protein [Caudoviricetes sp.]
MLNIKKRFKQHLPAIKRYQAHLNAVQTDFFVLHTSIRVRLTAYIKERYALIKYPNHENI